MLGGGVSHFYHYIFTNGNCNGNGNDKFNLNVFGGVVSQGRTTPPPDTAVVLNLEPAIRKKYSLILFTYLVKTKFSFFFLLFLS